MKSPEVQVADVGCLNRAVALKFSPKEGPLLVVGNFPFFPRPDGILLKK